MNVYHAIGGCIFLVLFFVADYIHGKRRLARLKKEWAEENRLLDEMLQKVFDEQDKELDETYGKIE